MSNSNKIHRYSIMLLFTVVSAVIQAISFTSFVEVGGFYPGGIAGICRLMCSIDEKFFKGILNYSFLYFFFNLILSVFVFRRIGKRFTLFSLLQTSLVSIFILIFKPLILIDDPILMAIFGGIINGFGAGLALAHDLSTGGFDFISVYFSSKSNKSTWNSVLIVNAIVLCAAGLLFDWEVALYSIIFQYATTQLIKALHKRYTHDTITIITSKPDEVSNEILSRIRHSITISKGVGAYKHKEEDILYTVVNSYQTDIVISAAKHADPHVFINVQNSKKVIGNYFQQPLD